MTTTQQLLIEIIKNEILGADIDLGFAAANADWAEVFALAEHHDMAHVVGNYCLRRGGTDEKYRSAVTGAVRRFTLLSAAITDITGALVGEGIPFICLKGAAIRSLYPVQWLRTSCDVDILVPEAALDQAVRALQTRLGYTPGQRGHHDVSMVSPTNVHLELHFSVNEHMAATDDLLNRCWDFARPLRPGEPEYVFTPEYRMFYFFAHAARHFTSGGCGLKTLTDLYLLRQKPDYDEAALRALLAEGHLTAFADALTRLTEVWFGHGVPDSLTDAMGEYIWRGGVYGTLENHMKVKAVSHTTLTGFLAHRLWLPYGDLAVLYPAVRKCRLLVPLFQARRWLGGVKKEKRRRLAAEIGCYKTASAQKNGTVAEMLTELGLGTGRE